MHTPMHLKQLTLAFPHKTCFDSVSVQIPHGSRIGIIGRNGAGKSSLLALLRGVMAPSSGQVIIPPDVIMGYVPQILDDGDAISGAERLNKAITAALAQYPNVLLLDEPTNHLDARNRKSLLRMLAAFPGTLIIVSHDRELLRGTIDTLWHIDQGNIRIFSGNYDDYLREIEIQRNALQAHHAALSRQQQAMHQALMQEQVRAAKSRAKGAKSISERKWPTIVSNAKASRSENTTNRKKADIRQKKQALSEQLANLKSPEILMPTFSFQAALTGSVVSVVAGSVGYVKDAPILTNIYLSIAYGERLAILGDNASGKTTLIKAMLNEPSVFRTGDWVLPKRQEIGYLDQHYSTLNRKKTVFETLQDCVPQWSHLQIRRHLCDFLFRNNDEVYALVHTLSGGEKTRLCLAQIAAATPRLLILDEVTNNLDLETYEHLVQVLNQYPGTLIVISHQPDFLNAIHLTDRYEMK